MLNLTQCVVGAAVASLVTIAPLGPALSQMQQNPAWTIMKPEPTSSRASPHKAKAASAKRPDLASRNDEEATQQNQRKLTKRSTPVSDKTDAAAPKSVAASAQPPHHVVIQVTQND